MSLEKRFPVMSGSNRRVFLRQMAAAGVGVMGLGALAACGSGQSSGPVKVTVGNMPAETDKEGLATFKKTVAAFEKKYPDVKITGHSYFFDPSTFYTRYAAGQAEDTLGVFFTEPQFMIRHRYIADITDSIKDWEYYSSIAPSVVKIISNESGRVYGVPVDAYKLCLVYNRKLFKQAGLDPDKPPTTWDDFRGYAKQLTGKGVFGFAEATKDRQGGWVFTNWLYSAGGQAEQLQDGKWKATFNDTPGVKVMQLFKDMRWKDGSMPTQALLNMGDTQQLLAKGQVGMAIGTAGSLASLHDTYNIPFEDIAVSAMPQNGGNAALGGGYVYVFNSKSAPEVVKGAYEWVIFNNFNLANFESDTKATAAQGKSVGGPDNEAFVGKLRDDRRAIIDKYANIPKDTYQHYADGNVQLMPEPSVESQQYYALIDPIKQSILTDANADPKALLDQAAQQFQQRVLDTAKS